MSQATSPSDVPEQGPELIAWFEGWLRDYCKDRLGEFIMQYPDDETLTLSWSDLSRASSRLAEQYLKGDREDVKQYIRLAVGRYDFPVENALDEDAADELEIRMVDLHDSEVYTPMEVVKQDPSGYIGVRGELAKVTAPAKKATIIEYECTKCGTPNQIPQLNDGDVKEPHECVGCERKGPFQVNKDGCNFSHYAKARIETPPDRRGELQDEYIDGTIEGDLVWHGHEEYGLIGRTGDSVTIYGDVEMVQTEGDGAIFESEIDVKAIEFDTDEDDVNIEAHRETFEDYARRDDAVDLFAESLVPHLYATPEWETALELLVAYLFAAPRVDLPDGPTYRGDVHALIISDYGMGKSMVNSAVADYSPKCIKESVTGMSSDVALLAAATEDDFGNGQWTLQPGILVRANGGHVILDEIDKTDVNLERMNNALEGEQVVDVNKAGQSATYKSRVGLLATGNPEESRFDASAPISDQLGLDQSLLSRFDGIVTMEDHADEEQDGHIAETQGMAFVEAQEVQQGERDDLDRLDRHIEPDVGKAWVAEARQNCHPILQREHVEEIRDWYAKEVRPLNKEFNGESSGEDMPVPVSARVVMATIRFSVAFARVHLRERVRQADVDRAMKLSKSLVGQNFDGEKFVPQEVRQSGQTTEDPEDWDAKSNRERTDKLARWLHDNGRAELDEMADALPWELDEVEHALETAKQQGDIYEPETGVYQAV
jgi:replicative DNA helicase Mcm